jgi:hypothetical protein
MSEPAAGTPFILPAGTQVVTLVEVRGTDGALVHPRGAVGVIVKAPVDAVHSYRVRFPDAFEAPLKRAEIEVRKVHQREGIAGSPTIPALGSGAGVDLEAHVIYRCIVGSRAYGLDEEGSDTDRRGIYLPPAELHWSLAGVPEQLERDETQECYFELQKFLTLALKANPNVLECLYTPLVEHATPLAAELLAMREAFLSRLVYQTYNGYVLSQFKKIGQDLRARGAIKWKHAMHLLRLLVAGVTALRDGVVPVRVEAALRDRLLAIRRGEVPWEEVEDWRLALHKELDAAYAATRLPERPDYERVNRFLIAARRTQVAPAASSLLAAAPVAEAALAPIPEHARPRLREEVRRHRYPLVFATVSGAHLYGFPSPDSDFDLRGVHVLPAREALRLDPRHETVESSKADPIELDLVTHDAAKFFRLLLKKNGYVLEQVYSPIVVHTTAAHEELKAIARGCITRHHAHHYLGFAATQWKLFEKERRVKPLLYVYRVLLTGIHLVRTGEVEANLVALNERFKLPFLADLIARKLAGPERGRLDDADLDLHRREHDRLRADLEAAPATSPLPEGPAPKTKEALDDLLVRLRLS